MGAPASEKVVVGIFADKDQARQAVAALLSAGFVEDQVGMVARDPRDDTPIDRAKGPGWETTGVGAAVGAVTATGLGLAAVAGLIPGIGPALAAGALVALLSSAGAGAVAGGLIGTLVGWGLSEDEARRYEKELAAGRTLVSVICGARCEEAVTILRDAGALQEEVTSSG